MNATEKVEPTTVSGITRVLMHEPDHFTFLVPNTNNKKLGQLRIRTYQNQTTIVTDLQDNESIKIQYLCGNLRVAWSCESIPQDFSTWNVDFASQLIIHLHSAKDIDGAGWNHGKFGSGNTTVVQ